MDELEDSVEREKKVSFGFFKNKFDIFGLCLVVIQVDQTILMGFSSRSSWCSVESLMKLQHLEDFTRYPNVQLA